MALPGEDVIVVGHVPGIRRVVLEERFEIVAVLLHQCFNNLPVESSENQE